MVASINDEVRLYRRTGTAQYQLIPCDERIKYRYCLGDVFVSYSQMVLVMFDFFKQLAMHVSKATIDIGTLRNKRICDTDMDVTMQWIQGLEWSTTHTAAKMVVDKPKERTNEQAYRTTALPYAILLYTQHLLHRTIKRSHHELAQRTVTPLLTLLLEGYILYRSTLEDSMETYRSATMQDCLLLNVNHRIQQRAKAIGDELAKEEDDEKERSVRKAERKKLKRERLKKNKQTKKSVKEIAPSEKIIQQEVEELVEGQLDSDDDDDSVIIIMDALSPYAKSFTPSKIHTL